MTEIKRPKTSCKQKFILLGAGVFVTLLLLEGGLRLGGFVFNSLQEQRNRATFSANEVRILCIGESTTALGGWNSYPLQLQKLLRQKMPDKNVKVINKGLVSKTSLDILRQLDANLNKYRPAIVVGMIGVNDVKENIGGNIFLLKVERQLERLRIFHFAELLIMHLQNKFQRTAEPGNAADMQTRTGTLAASLEEDPPVATLADTRASLENLERVSSFLKEKRAGTTDLKQQDKILYELARVLKSKYYLLISSGHYCRVRQKYAEAEEFLRQAIEAMPSISGAYIELARCLIEQGDYRQARDILLQALTVEPQSVIAKMELGRCYRFLGLKEETYDIYKEAFEEDESLLHADADIGDWLIENNFYKEAELVLRLSMEKNPEDFATYKKLAVVYNKLGDQSRADSCAAKGKALQAQKEAYWPGTVRNYNEIVQRVLDRGMTFVAMQYPLRAVEPLKDVFWNKDPRLYFVENKDNFEKVIEREGYSACFSDNFAGHFGHCTGKGNRLLAENLSGVILRIIADFH